MKLAVGCRRESLQACSRAGIRAPYSVVGMSTAGNKSLMMLRNRGMSSRVNLGRFTA